MIRFTALSLVTVIISFHALDRSHAAEGEDGWVSLFDGKTLDGWKQLGGEAKYSVEDGEIVGTSVPNTSNSFLCTEKSYGNFVLELEFKVHPELNSGIQIRSNSLPEYKKGRVHGYQVEIDASDRGWSGGIYDEGRRGWLNTLEQNSAARYAFKQNEWNHFRIRAAGDSIKTWVNGAPAADLVDSMTQTGFIALQVHGVGGREDPVWVRWRNIRIKELKSVESDAECAADEKAAPAESADDQPIVPEGAEVKKLHDGFAFTEGPARGPDGKIYFTDIPNERIHVYDPATGELGIFREETGRANGLMFAPSGALYACEGGNRRLTRQFGDQIETLADTYEEKKLNSPNDIAMDGKGGVYFTDPRYGSRDDMELDVEGVYHLPRRGKLKRVVDDLVRPNGLILSLDKRILYVVDNGAKTIWAYDVESDGSLSGGRKFADMDLEARGGGDGMTIDQRGNIYCAGQGHIWIWNPKGDVVAKIAVPESPANCTFGGPDGKTLCITARTGVYSIKLNVVGGR